MNTNRRDFLGLVAGAITALTVPWRQRPKALPAPAIQPVVETGINAVPVTGRWVSKCESFAQRNMAGETVAIVDAFFREEYEGPIELLNFGSKLDGPIVISERTISLDQQGYRHEIVKAVRYPKVEFDI
jgi:hypothetical protein